MDLILIYTTHTKFRIFIFVAQPPLSLFQWYEKIWFFELQQTQNLEFYICRAATTSTISVIWENMIFWITTNTKFRIFIFVAQPPLSLFQWYEKIWCFKLHQTQNLEFLYLWRSHHYHNFSDMRKYDFLNHNEHKI